MLKDDRNVLAILVKEYSLAEVTRILVEVAYEESDHLSDAGLKEKAIEMYENGSLLQRSADEMHLD